MFWISLGLIVASFIGFVILRIENAPEGDEYYESDADDGNNPDVSDEDDEDSPTYERLRILKYVTFTLMAAGLIMFVVYAFVTA